MKPIETDQSNVRLILGGDRTGDHDLPAERVVAHIDCPACPDDETNPDCRTCGGRGRIIQNAFETLWRLEPDEIKAIQNGAVIQLRVFGGGHPPISLGVTEPDPRIAAPLLTLQEAGGALGYLYTWLNHNALPDSPEGLLRAFEQALKDLRADGGPDSPETPRDLGT